MVIFGIRIINTHCSVKGTYSEFLIAKLSHNKCEVDILLGHFSKNLSYLESNTTFDCQISKRF